MSVLEKLSSQVGDRSEAANLQVVEQCLAERGLLAEIAQGLHSRDAALAGDCAEVMTKVAERQPDWVVPYAEGLSGLLGHKQTRPRWEAAHALALVAATAPQVVGPLLPRFAEIIHKDGSTIVRDYTIDTVANYASLDAGAAREAFPILQAALTLWNGKHAAHALNGLVNVSQNAAELNPELHALSQPYLEDPRGVVRKAARRLQKASRIE